MYAPTPGARARGDIQSAPPPEERERRRRTGFALMDAAPAEEEDFVTNDLAQRSSLFNQGLHEVTSYSRPRRA